VGTLDTIQKLREQTGLGVMDLKKALEEANGNEEQALEILKKKGATVAQKRAERATAQGLVTAYVHGGRIASLVELNCETDFVAKTEDFQLVAKDLAMQIASMNPETVDALLEQPFVKDPSKTVQDLIIELVAKTGENIKIGQFSRIELGAA